VLFHRQIIPAQRGRQAIAEGCTGLREGLRGRNRGALYPVEPKKSGIPDLFAFHGLASMFRGAGFKEVARRSETRPIMRYVIGSP